MYKAIIVENSVKEVNHLIGLLTQYCPQVYVITYALNFDSGSRLMKKHQPDILIINPKISKKNCQLFLEKCKMLCHQLIFISPDEKETLMALRHAATDYLLKPLKYEELQQAMVMAMKNISIKKSNEHHELLVKNIYGNHSSKSKKFAVPTIEGLVFVKMDEIIRFEANGTYTNIYTVKKEKIVASKNVKEFEDILPKNQFFRIHNSHLVNINRLAKYTKGRGGTITMEDGTQIEVASRRKNDFLEIFSQY